MGGVGFFVGAAPRVLVAFGGVSGCGRGGRPFYGVIRLAGVAFAQRRRRFAQRLGFGLGRPREVAPSWRDFREKRRRFGRRPSGCETDVERGDRAFPVSGRDGGGETLGIVRGFGGRIGGREEGS